MTALAFDLDGTLFDHEQSSRVAVAHFARGLGVEPTDALAPLWFAAEDEHFESWRSGQISFDEQRRRRLRTFLPGLGVNVPSTDAELDAVFTTYLRHYQQAWMAYPGAIDLLTEVRLRGLRTGVLTNGSEDQQTAKLRATGLLPLIDVVCTSEGLGVAKPDPRAFHALCSRLDAAPELVGFVGDHPEHDVAAGRAAGLRTALVDHTGVRTGRVRTLESAVALLDPTS